MSTKSLLEQEKIPTLDLSLVKSEKLVNEVQKSIKQSAKQRRNVGLLSSARVFNKIRILKFDNFEQNSQNQRRTSLTHRHFPSPSNKHKRKIRFPLSTRLPPKMTLPNPSKTLIHKTHRSRVKLLINEEKALSSATSFKKRNYDETILSLLDCRRMEELKDAFIKKDHELEFNEFVETVWAFMNVEKHDEAFAISALVELFQDIDINDDKKMQWSEFSDFLCASQRHSSDQEINLPKYELDTMTKPYGLNGGRVIQEIKYSVLHNLICILASNSKIIRIYNHEKNREFSTISKGHRNYIISCTFLDGFDGILITNDKKVDKHANNPVNNHQNKNKNQDKWKNIQTLVATSSLDETIVIWLVSSAKSKKKPLRMKTLSVDSPHNLIYWSVKKKLFVSADMNYNLYIWDNKIQQVVWKRKYHSDLIVHILIPKNTSMLLSASLDTTVVAYDLSADRIKYKLNSHSRGLISMAYKSSLHILVTAAAEHTLRVSDGIVGRPLAILQGHCAPVIAMISIPNTAGVVSLDASNAFKLWDIRKMECIQSLHFSYRLRNVSALISLQPNFPKIALGATSLHFLRLKQGFTNGNSNNQSSVGISSVDIETVCGLFILEYKSQILTVHETMIKKWNLSTGKMIKLIKILPGTLSKSHTITCSQVSNTKKLLLIGTSNGLVAIVSIYTGGLVMLCTPNHSKSVIFVNFHKTMIISIDSKGCIFKYNAFKHWLKNINVNTNINTRNNVINSEALPRSKLVNLPIPHNYNIKHSEYIVCCIHDTFDMLIIGMEYGLLRFFNLTTDKVILDLNILKDCVTSITINYKDNLLFTTSKSGNICCWELPKQYPSRLQFYCKCLYRVKNNDDMGFAITTFCFDYFDKYIVTGDARGLIKIWSVNEAKETVKTIESKVFSLTEPKLDETTTRYECKLMKSIQASSDWINNILIVTNNSIYKNDDNNILCILSGSIDGSLFAWKLNGECIGELTYVNKADNIQWKVPIDMKRKEKEKLEYGLKLLKQMEL